MPDAMPDAMRPLATPAEEAPYPPAPWRAQMQCWMGLFRSDLPARLPRGLRPLLGRRLRVIAVARYLPGSALAYDELVIGTPALLGARPGLYVEYMWVDSVASLWGGRRIWGLPKELAEFAWDERGVRVADSAGTLLALDLAVRSVAHGPRLPLATASIGRLGDNWTYALFPMRMRLGRAGMRLRDASPRFGFTLHARPVLAAASPDCRATFPAPRLIPAR